MPPDDLRKAAPAAANAPAWSARRQATPNGEGGAQETISLTDSGRSKRWGVVAVGGMVTLLIVGGAVSLAAGLGDEAADDGAAAAASAVPSTTASIERRTLSEHAELDGTLGYGDLTSISLAAQGTVTSLPALGSLVDRGGTLLEVNGRPVSLLIGDQPLWRELGPESEDGPDIQQLEANLVAIGVVSQAGLTVDENWTGVTTAAVKDWQEALGVKETGRVALGDVVFMPGKVRIAGWPTALGAPIGEAAVDVTDTTRLVTIDLEVTRQSLVEEGQSVVVVLPDGGETTGTVTSIGDVATAEEVAEGEAAPDPTIEVVVSLDDPAASGTLDEAPVTVKVETSAAEDVLAVPVEALLAAAEGGYAVEFAHHDGTTSLVAIELGAEADGWVEVTGEVAEGDKVVIPDD